MLKKQFPISETEKDKEIIAALKNLKGLDLPIRQQAIAACAEKSDFFSAKFFALVIESEGDPICKWYAIRSLGYLKAIDYGNHLIEILRNPDVSVGESSLHLICARSIGLLGSQMVSRVLTLLNEESLATRLAAIDALGEIGDASAIPMLAHWLLFGEWKLKIWAALSLAKIGQESIPALIDAFSVSNKEEKLVILDAIIMIGTHGAIKEVAEIARKEPSIIHHYFKRERSGRAQDFLKTMLEIVSTESPAKDQAALILSVLGSYGTLKGTQLDNA